MKQKERGLEEALIARDQFLSIASHELKTPLTSLKLQAQLTLRSLQLGKEISIERQIAMAHQTSDLVGRLTGLIDDMLDVSRIKTGKLQLDKSEQELGNIVREVVLRMSLLFEAAKLKLPSIDAPEKLIGDWDRFRLEQVIGNLLTNAIRYGKGRPIEIKLRKNDDKALLTVTDHGYGIAKKDLNRIFGRFERANNSSEVSGLGLGLFISKEIVETQQGRIWVESEVDKGSTFFIELPLKNNGA
jgi:signal transduction histidine kinase